MALLEIGPPVAYPQSRHYDSCKYDIEIVVNIRTFHYDLITDRQNNLRQTRFW
jgi:hypothetical protein